MSAATIGAPVPMEPRDPRADVVVVRVSDRRDRAAIVLVAVALAAMLVAVVKPWGPMSAVPGTGADRSAAGIATRPIASVPGGPAVSPGSAAGGLDQRPEIVIDDCYSGLAWRLFSIQRDFGRLARWWLRMDTVAAATGPSDPAIPSVTVTSQEALGIGFCAPFRLASARPTIDVEAWSVDAAGRPQPLELRPIRTAGPAPGHGAIYEPPPPPGQPATAQLAWAPGRYVFAVFGVDTRPVWFAVSLQAPVLAEAVPAR
jgi:hypothetical protein